MHPVNDQSTPLVLVWDLDETLLIFNSLVNGKYADANPHSCSADHDAARALGLQWQDLILDALDGNFSFSELEEVDVVNLRDVGAAGAAERAAADAPMGLPNAEPPKTASQAPGDSKPSHRPVKRLCTRQLSEDDPALCAQLQQQQASAEPQLTFPQAQSHHEGGACCLAPLTEGIAAPPSELLDSEEGSQEEQAQLPPAAMAKLYAQVRDTYDGGTEQLKRRMLPDMAATWQDLYRRSNALTGGWLTSAQHLLTDITSLAAAGSFGGGRPVAVHHFVVSTGQLVATLGKMVLFDLAHAVPAQNVLSASKESKLFCFRYLEALYEGVAAKFCAIGDGAEEQVASAAMGWPFIKIVLGSSRAPAHPATTPGSISDTAAGTGKSAAGNGERNVPEAADRASGQPAGDRGVSNGSSSAPPRQNQGVLVNGQRIDELAADTVVQYALNYNA